MLRMTLCPVSPSGRLPPCAPTHHLYLLHGTHALRHTLHTVFSTFHELLKIRSIPDEADASPKQAAQRTDDNRRLHRLSSVLCVAQDGRGTSDGGMKPPGVGGAERVRTADP